MRCDQDLSRGNRGLSMYLFMAYIMIDRCLAALVDFEKVLDGAAGALGSLAPIPCALNGLHRLCLVRMAFAAMIMR